MTPVAPAPGDALSSPAVKTTIIVPFKALDPVFVQTKTTLPAAFVTEVSVIWQWPEAKAAT